MLWKNIQSSFYFYCSGIHEKSISTLSQVPVVVVHCGATWGSGIIVDLFQGIILTCGHVVKKASEGKFNLLLSHICVTLIAKRFTSFYASEIY